jgi:hypothetical protein
VAQANNNLVLGWKVDNAGNPSYWLKQTAVAGSQKPGDLVTVPAKSIGAHTAIIAQSGSGKSFFLGRLIEEILLNTKARCVIFDPNADFRHIHEVVEDSLWQSSYDLELQRGKLPHEANGQTFRTSWERISKRIRMRNPKGTDTSVQDLQFWWPYVSAQFLAGEVEPMLRGDVFLCHTFVQAMSRLLMARAELAGRQEFELIKDSEDLFWEIKNIKDADKLAAAENILRREFNVDKLKTAWPHDISKNGPHTANTQELIRDGVEKAIDTAPGIPERVAESTARYYFGKANIYQSSGILEKRNGIVMKRRLAPSPSDTRLEVIDLPSIGDIEARLMAINSVIEEEWERARNGWEEAMKQPEDQDKRIPTFIIVDEAHNVVPSDIRDNKSQAALREQFRRIAAEGRKYGLFLILVSQRPEKLDPLVVSECENKAIMRLGSATVLEATCKMLGLEDIPRKTLEKCLDFGTGRVLITGEWTEGVPQLLYSAARRTVEGGRSLRSKYWAQA